MTRSFVLDFLDYNSNTENLKKMPLTVKEAEDLFNKMDQNSDGKCSIHEVKKFLQAFCAETYGDKSDQEFCKIVMDWDKDDDNMVDREEFVNDLTKESRETAMMKAFTDMDADGSGKITEDECRRALKDNGICDDDTLQKLFGWRRVYQHRRVQGRNEQDSVPKIDKTLTLISAL